MNFEAIKQAFSRATWGEVIGDVIGLASIVLLIVAALYAPILWG